MKYTRMIVFLAISLIILPTCKESTVGPDYQFVQIQFKYNFKDELNTFKNYYQKDLVLDGVVRVYFRLTKDEQNKILAKAYETNFFSMPDTLLNKAPVEITPNPTQYLRIRYGNQENAVVWNYILYEYQSDQYKRLCELTDYLTDIIESKPEYKILPPRQGGYD